jgi:formylglycine-generating enzyme required for sulfatase activity
MSPSGAFDMVGNAAEWTSDGTINGGTSLKNG